MVALWLPHWRMQLVLQRTSEQGSSYFLFTMIRLFQFWRMLAQLQEVVWIIILVFIYKEPWEMDSKIVRLFFLNSLGNYAHSVFGLMWQKYYVTVWDKEARTDRDFKKVFKACVIWLTAFSEKYLALLQSCRAWELKACTNLWKQ